MNHHNNNVENGSSTTTTATTLASSPDSVLLGPPMLTPNPLQDSSTTSANVGETVNVTVFDHGSSHPGPPPAPPQDGMMKPHSHVSNGHPQSNPPQADMSIVPINMTMTINGNINGNGNMNMNGNINMTNMDGNGNNASNGSTMPILYSNNWEVSNPLAGSSINTTVNVSNPITSNTGNNTNDSSSSHNHHDALTPPSILPVGRIRVPNPFNVGKPTPNFYNTNTTTTSTSTANNTSNTNNPISNNTNSNTAHGQMTSHNYGPPPSSYHTHISSTNANTNTNNTNTNTNLHNIINTNNNNNNTNNPPSNNDNSANNRRQKRLERNRESARLSRRRRKQYLEILEDRVSALSVEMDEGRIKHAKNAVPTILTLRQHKIGDMEMALDKYWKVPSLEGMLLQDSPSNGEMDRSNEEEKKEGCFSPTPEGPSLTHAAKTTSTLPLSPSSKQLLEQQDHELYSFLSRSSNHLRVVAAFQTQQFKSYVFPPHVRFIQWLTLQNDVYFLGGRAASERLSAARIGERMLNAGNDRVTPAHGMWPLLCNEINLSYDQEERVRSFQRNTLTRPDSWLDYRHNTQASKNVNDNLYKCLLSFSQLSKEREETVVQRILTPEQRSKLQVWIRKKKKWMDSNPNTTNQQQQQSQQSCPSQQMQRIRQFLKKTLLKSNQAPTLDTSPNYHDATNIYIINNHLQSVLNTPTVPAPQPVVHGRVHMKRLSRRPPFESLGGSGTHGNSKDCHDENGKGGLNRDRSYSSSGSLKRCASGISIHERDRSSSISSANDMNGHSTNVSPEAAQATTHASVVEALKPAGITLPERTYVPPMDGSGTGRGARVDVVMTSMNPHQMQPQHQPSHVHYPNNKLHKNMTSVAVPINSQAPVDQSMEPTWNDWENNTYTTTTKESYIPTIPLSSNTNVAPAPMTTADRQEQTIMTNFYENSQPHEQHPQQQQQFSSMRNSVSVPSILPSTNSEMNIVPEEDEFNTSQAVDDYLLDLGNENDWAIGGFDDQ